MRVSLNLKIIIKVYFIKNFNSLDFPVIHFCLISRVRMGQA